MKVIRQKDSEETGRVLTDKDILDWLKFAQSETDGVKLDLSKLAQLAQGEMDYDSRQLAQVIQPQQLAVAGVHALVDAQPDDDKQLDDRCG